MNNADALNAADGQPAPERRWLTVGVLAALCALSAIGGYIELYATFQPYDDEGYFMLSVRHMLDGATLYGDISVTYGPTYFLLQRILRGLFNIPLTNDAVRLITLAIWILLSLGAAYTVRPRQWRVGAASLAYVLTFQHLVSCVDEPGHAQEVAALLLAAAALLPIWLGARRTVWLATALGALAGAALLVKINIGIFCLVTLAGVGATAAARRPWRSPLRALVALGCVSLPWVLLRGSLTGPDPWPYVTYATVVSLALAGALLTGYSRSEFSAFNLGWREGVGAAAGWLGAVGLVVGLTLAQGTTLTGLLQGIVLKPLARMPGFTAFGWNPPASPYAIAGALAAAGAAVALLVLRRRQSAWGATFETLLKIGYGMAMVGWVAFGRGAVFQYAAPWAWLLWLPPASRPVPDQERLCRLVLVWLALPHVLLAYPVPGSQLAFGTFLLVPVAVWCLSDGLEDLKARLPLPLKSWAPRLCAAGMIIAMLGAVGAWALHLRVARWHYIANVPLGLPGAQRVRVEPQRAELYRTMAQLLREHADTFLCTIGLNSMYTWSGLKPPGHIVISDELTMSRTEAEQRQLMASLLAHARPILIYRDNLFEKGNPNAPFFQLIRTHFRDWRVLDDGYRLMVPIVPEAGPGQSGATAPLHNP